MGLGSKTSSKASMGGAGAEENERLHCVITEKDAAITALQVRQLPITTTSAAMAGA